MRVSASDRGRAVGPGRFVTRFVRPRPDGAHEIHTSRRYRKGLAPIVVRDGDPLRTVVTTRGNWRRLWEPRSLSWWIAVLFLVGSAHFTAGGYLAAFRPEVAAALVNGVFFAGSVFFTSAAYLQLLQALNADVAEVASAPSRWRWFGYRARNLGYLASLVQLLGTVLFNFDCADAMLAGLSWREEDFAVWMPNMLGCACFLIASALAYLEISHGKITVELRHLSWWIAVSNLLGSVWFQVSALYSFTGPGSTDEHAIWLASFYTLLGAVCFLVGSYLLLPEAFDESGGAQNAA